MVEYGNNGIRKCWNIRLRQGYGGQAGRRHSLEGRALSRPATTKRGPPEADIPFPHQSNIPIFHYSSEYLTMENHT